MRVRGVDGALAVAKSAAVAARVRERINRRVVMLRAGERRERENEDAAHWDCRSTNVAPAEKTKNAPRSSYRYEYRYHTNSFTTRVPGTRVIIRRTPTVLTLSVHV